MQRKSFNKKQISKDINWPTKDNDLQSASLIIDKHLELNNGEPLLFVDLVFDKNSEIVDIDIPEWVDELMDFFFEKYGYHEGRNIASKVLTKCFLSGQTIH